MKAIVTTVLGTVLTFCLVVGFSVLIDTCMQRSLEREAGDKTKQCWAAHDLKIEVPFFCAKYMTKREVE